MKSLYQIPLTPVELSLKGYNWGDTEFSSSTLSFNVAKKQAFELPLSKVSNTNLGTKGEVAVEFVVGDGSSGKDGGIGGNGTGKKGEGDCLVEMRFYVPGVATVSAEDGSGVRRKKKKKEPVLSENGEVIKAEDQSGSEEDESEEEILRDEDGEEMTAATVFYESLKQKADVGIVVGDVVCSFTELLCLIPRYVKKFFFFFYFFI